MVRILVLFFLGILLFTPLNGEGQNATKKTDDFRFGLLTGAGRHWLLKVNYDYRLIMFQPQIYQRLYERKLHHIELMVFPQLNVSYWTENKGVEAYKTDVEFGVNAGFMFRQMLKGQRSGVYAFVSSGPHFVSDVPKRQSPGFLFASQLGAGLTLKITERLSLDFRSAYRHISNAGLKEPNAGVESWLFLAGIILEKPIIKQ